MRNLRYFAAILCAAFLIAADQPNAVINVHNVHTLQSGTFPNNNFLAIGGYHFNGDNGGGALHRDSSGTACALDSGITCFSDNAGNVFRRDIYTGNLPEGGAYCDGKTLVLSGTIASGSHTFTRTDGLLFTSSDIGDVFELNYSTGSMVAPFVTSITAVNGAQATLNTAAPATYPGTLMMTTATMSFPDDGNDTAGSGLHPGQTGTAVGGTFTTAATATIKYTQLVALGALTGGTGYNVGNILAGTAGFSGTGAQKQTPEIQVTSIGGSGDITGYTFISNGSFSKNNPNSFTWTGGDGTGFSAALLATDGSFGANTITLANKGSYSVVPANPVTMSAGTGWTADFVPSYPDWTYGHDDTTAIQAMVAYSQNLPTTSRGIVDSLTIPFGTECLYRNFEITKPIAILSTGIKQGELLRIPGSAGLSVGGSPPASIVIDISFPGNDDYQQARYGSPEQTLQNLTIAGMSTYGLVNVDGVISSDSVGGVVLTNPTSNKGKAIQQHMSNVQISRFPGTLLESYDWGGTITADALSLFNAGNVSTDFTGTSHTSTTIDGISSGDIANITLDKSLVPSLSIIGPGIPAGTTITAIGATSITLSQATTSGLTEQFSDYGGGDCLSFFGTANPTNISKMKAGQCNIGLHIHSSSQLAFYGYTSFSNNMSLYVDGNLTQDSPQIDIFNGQLTESRFENAYFDQVGQTVFCYSCRFIISNKSGADAGDSDADVVMGPDMTSGSPNKPFRSVQMDAWQTSVDFADTNVLFNQTAAGDYCGCWFVSGGFSISSRGQGFGAPITNRPTQMVGPDFIVSPIQVNNVVMNPTVVGSLPSCTSSVQGMRGVVTDANSVTFHGTATGGGSNVVGVLCTGSAWVIN